MFWILIFPQNSYVQYCTISWCWAGTISHLIQKGNDRCSAVYCCSALMVSRSGILKVSPTHDTLNSWQVYWDITPSWMEVHLHSKLQCPCLFPNTSNIPYSFPHCTYYSLLKHSKIYFVLWFRSRMTPKALMSLEVGLLEGNWMRRTLH